MEAAQTRAQSGHGELGYGGLGHGWGLDGHGKADGKTGGQADGSASCQPNCQPNCQLNSAALDTDRDLAQDPAREPARIHDAQYSQAFSHRTRVLAAGLELAMETALEQAIVYRNLSVPELVEHALLRAEGGLSDRGALCVKTLPYSGITPSSYYRVCPGLTAGAGEDGADEDQAAQVADLAGQVWGGALQPMDPATFDGLYGRVLDYIQDRSLYQCDGSLGALLEQPGSPPRLRVVCELASQVLMARQWLGQAVSDQPGSSHTSPDPGQLTVIALPGLKGEPLLEPLIRAEVFIAVDAARGLALVAGSRHGGDLWGAIAALCAEVAAARSGDLLLWQRAIAAPLDLLAHPPQSPAPAALFLGAAGSGKQRLAASLSPDWQRGPWVWRSQGQIQPLLQGNYGRISSPEAQQSAYPHLGFGAVLENVPLEDSSSNPSFGDRRWGGAMAAAWPCPRPPSPSSPSYRPQAIFLLVADTSGLFPLLAKLSPAQAIYLVALGYGAALPGWERHLLQPQMLFGTADPQRCLRESLGLRDRLQAFPDTALYLLNTGWLGEMPSPGRSLDQRIPLSISQTLVKSGLGGGPSVGRKLR
ncbi:MAG: phosphoenolpyruvate carboxykinase (ATP) [Synechococcales cyanobacterium RM1_1_8]|nr:phosphoenolpyruvate carboxykinase (ATP) [Synechococcales cyanobacterium RM1_1_8]